MNAQELTPAELGLIRWFRSLDHRIVEAIHLWLNTGDSSLIEYYFSRRHLAAA